MRFLPKMISKHRGQTGGHGKNDGKWSIMIIGDLNSRMGTQKDFKMVEEEEGMLSEYHSPQLQNADAAANSNGYYCIGLCFEKICMMSSSLHRTRPFVAT